MPLYGNNKREKGYLKMKILITGANGFIGKNLIARLKKELPECIIYSADKDTTNEELEMYTKDCDFVYNFAAVHRPKDEKEFGEVNYTYFDNLLAMLKQHNNKSPVLYTSSIQATNGSEYGNSKLSAEAALKAYGEETGARAIVYRLTNTFGRWATPHHHSVVATFCDNLVHGRPIEVSDRDHVMNFYYIDDVIDDFMEQLNGKKTPDRDGVYRLKEEKIYSVKLGELADMLQDISHKVKQKSEISFNKEIEKLLYETYISYM